jgi:hypothetical protein
MDACFALRKYLVRRNVVISWCLEIPLRGYETSPVPLCIRSHVFQLAAPSRLDLMLSCTYSHPFWLETPSRLDSIPLVNIPVSKGPACRVNHCGSPKRVATSCNKSNRFWILVAPSMET